LGEGGMGRVFKARHLRMGRLAALKVIRKEKLASRNALRRFQREVRLAARLDHPNVVHAYDAGQVGSTHYFVMEYVEGTDLYRLVQKRGPLPVALACDYIRQAALGLQHAHECGVVHRDVKPHNLMVTPTDRVKVLDVGLALSAETAAEGLTRPGVALGTVDFLAPEQVTDPSSADARADLYGLGCTLYFLLTGRVPFPARAKVQKLLAHLGQEATPVNKIRPGVGPGVSAVVERLLAKRPDDRYPSAAALAEELERLAPSLPWEVDVLAPWSGRADDDTVKD
jgi:serine/threonine protein kinase